MEFDFHNKNLIPSLKDLNLKPDYNTEEDRIVNDFLKPCFSVSNRYDRAVGYFRANIYREMGEELLDFVIKGGLIRLVCSPDIPEGDENAARSGYELRGERATTEIELDLTIVMEAMSRNPMEVDCLNMLSLLIEKEALELFVATRPGGIFHRKIGLFEDNKGNTVVFSGSGNETRNAISSEDATANDESFDVYRSWGDDYEITKVENKTIYLNQLFLGGNGRTKVRPINQVEREVLAKYRTRQNYESCREGASKRSSSERFKKELVTPNQALIRGVSPYYYQVQAIEAWKRADCVGILAMATGTGKTITALLAIEQILKKGRMVLIIVPSTILLEQWRSIIRSVYPTVLLLLAGGEYDWRQEGTKKIFVSKLTNPRIILATMDTAASNDFIEFFSQAIDPAIVVDEAHRLGSPNRRQLMKLIFKEKLGLSATPERLFDQEGSEALDEFFGKMPVYSLPMNGSVRLSEGDKNEYPVLGQFLSKYNYYFKIAHLNTTEQKLWEELTKKIRKSYRHDDSSSSNQSLIDERTKLLLIKRSNVLKGASEKVGVACSIVQDSYMEKGRWIVYCQDENQLLQVFNELRRLDSHRNILMYHSKIDSKERELTLDNFEKNPGIIVSIKCLDEGVDVPSADGAIILASSTNPREYIQRRGRVLRKAKGKNMATIIDVLVLPNSSNDEAEIPISIVKGELARAYSFASMAENRDVMHELWNLCFEFGVNLETDSLLGQEEG